MISFSYHCLENPGLRVWLGYHPIASVDLEHDGYFSILFHSELSIFHEKKSEQETIEILSQEFLLSGVVFEAPVKTLKTIRTEVEGPRLTVLVSEVDDEYVVMNAAGVELKRFGSMRKAYEFAISASLGVVNKHSAQIDESLFNQRYINAYQLSSLFETYDA